MKSPNNLSQRLAKQWQQTSIREERLLSSSAWPVTLSIGTPSAKTFTENASSVQRHVQKWQEVAVGQVDWEPVKYRAGADAVRLPVRWNLLNPSQWIAACADSSVANEFAFLERLMEEVDELYRPLLIRHRSLWNRKSIEEVVETTRLASTLTPGCAEGRPLRLLAGHGVDTKFFERNSALLTRLLDERFSGMVSDQGLVSFLGAREEGDHWVLVAPLSDGLLPFKQAKVTTAELATTPLPSSRVLVVENERCVHLLPKLADTLAILGSGLDLQWLQGPPWSYKTVGYWGDMDSWGLLMLARARQFRPNLTPLLMNRCLFDRYAVGRAVEEPVTAQATAPDGLTVTEAEFYRYLMGQQRGRFEQEYVPRDEVEKALAGWVNTKSCRPSKIGWIPDD